MLMSGLGKPWKFGFVLDLDVDLAILQDFVVVDTPRSIQAVCAFSGLVIAVAFKMLRRCS